MQSITATIIEYPAINKAIFSAPPLVQGILLSSAAAAAVRVNIYNARYYGTSTPECIEQLNTIIQFNLITNVIYKEANLY